jgi:hypothetical protein
MIVEMGAFRSTKGKQTRLSLPRAAKDSRCAKAFEDLAMIQSTQALAETVLPPLVRDQPSDATKCPEDCPRADAIDAAEETNGMFVQAPRRIVHAAIRFGKSFELVIECCVL